MKRYPDWECPFRISGLRVRGLQYGYGVDAIQAITNALEGIRVTLARSGRRLSWLESGEAGFDRMVPLLFGPAFTKRLNRVIDHEFDAFARALERRHRQRAARRAGRAR